MIVTPQQESFYITVNIFSATEELSSLCSSGAFTNTDSMFVSSMLWNCQNSSDHLKSLVLNRILLPSAFTFAIIPHKDSQHINTCHVYRWLQQGFLITVR